MKALFNRNGFTMVTEIADTLPIIKIPCEIDWDTAIHRPDQYRFPDVWEFRFQEIATLHDIEIAYYEFDREIKGELRRKE